MKDEVNMAPDEGVYGEETTCAHCSFESPLSRPALASELPRMCPGCGHFGSLRIVVDGVQQGGVNA